MSDAKGIRQVGYLDCPGGGQVVVEGNTAFVGHMRNPNGTSVIDVTDPKNPKLLATVAMPTGTHSHKVRVGNSIMLTNHEIMGTKAARGEVAPDGYRGGLGIYDIENPAKPRLILNWEVSGKAAPGTGVHRFDFDGRYAYISPTCDGYAGNIVMILDLQDPSKPQEVGRWWMPGQWTAGGEKPTWTGSGPRCHHPLRVGNRLYTSYWYGGFVILDIDDMTKPKYVSGLNWHPPFPWPTHTALKVPFKIEGRDLLVVSDEDVTRMPDCPPYSAAFLWVVDITDEKRPVQFASYQLPHMPETEQPFMTGCHQPVEKITSPQIPVAWFAHGLRVIDISKPHAPQEVAYYMPDVPEGSQRVQSNDVFVDNRGLIYLLDRVRGLNILERI
jgi:hypothetical protein